MLYPKMLKSVMAKPDLFLERALWEKGLVNVVGVDEAGRGPLAGPVAAGAVVVHSERQVVALVKDSKKMAPWQREKAFEEIKQKSSGFGIGLVGPQEIDELGIALAVQKAMSLALKEVKDNFDLEIDWVIVDGSRVKPLPGYEFQRIAGGDGLHYSIAAASVLAKVSRDRLMKKLAQEFPQYGFERHVGYGTRTHFEAIKKYGLCPLHRKTFLKNQLV
jgi:ribonuclease HII